MSRAKSFREAMKRGMVAAPGYYDCITARSIERAGFEAAYMTGAGTAASLGYPDYGLVTMSEMAENAGRIAAAIKLPVIADADTGYGNELNVIRTVREYEKQGVAGIHIEDQGFPKKCGHLEDKTIVPIDDYVAEIRAAASAKADPDFLLIARTDSRAALGFEEAIRRANAAIEVGADMAFVEAPQSREETAAVPKLEGPVHAEHGVAWQDAGPRARRGGSHGLCLHDPAGGADAHRGRRLRRGAARSQGPGPPSGAGVRHHAATGLPSLGRRRVGPLQDPVPRPAAPRRGVAAQSYRRGGAGSGVRLFWTMDDIVGLIGAAAPAKRGPYKIRAITGQNGG
jgi:hypothetical protein